ncbi:hypothetical protein [Aquimarina algiphila]|uniref:hypothetical protein n=1 Tax=Aquimarina algiphila TaxID=2047982 RepID=UPI00232C69EE|nr:hypothetical protein [Aquimarina algiphila]
MKKVISLITIIILLFSCSKDDTPQNTIPQNAAPQLENQEFTVVENIDETTAIGTIAITGANSNEVSYSITTNDNDLFTVNEMGELYVAPNKQLNYDIAQTHTITVEVSSGTKIASANITIKVINIADVYIAGQNNDGKPAIWKNGIITELPVPATDWFSSGKVDIQVSKKGDVYAIGSIFQGESRIVLWNNGEPTTLAFESKKARDPSLYINNEKVYATWRELIPGGGSPYANIILYKNGERTNLNPGTITIAESKDISIFGDDTYVVGYDDAIDGQPSREAVLWKNTTKLPLNDTTGTLSNNLSSSAHSIFISDTGSAYIPFVEIERVSPQQWEHTLKLWKDNVVTTFSAQGETNGPVYPTSIFVANNISTYIVGTQYNGTPGSYTSFLWEIKETEIERTTFTNVALNSVSVFNDDVYVLGYSYSENEVKFWKNGIKVPIEGLQRAEALFIK